MKIYQKWWFWLFMLIALAILIGFIKYVMLIKEVDKSIDKGTTATDTTA